MRALKVKDPERYGSSREKINQGIDFQNALLGNHDVFFSTSPEERREVLFHNLKTGMDKECSALYIAGGESVEQIQAGMRSFGLKTDNPDRLKIITSHEWFMPDEKFQAERVIGQYRRLASESLTNGFRGLYVSADATEMFDHFSNNLKLWLGHESSIGKTFKFPLEIVCAYRLDQLKSDDQALLQLVHAHRNIITSAFLDSYDLFRSTFTETLNQLLGEEACKVVLYHLDKKLKLEPVPNSIELLKVLDDIFDGAKLVIEQEVARNLRKKIEACHQV